MTTYKCKECSAKASVKDGVIKRSCEHATAGVVAECKATCYGVGHASGIAGFGKLMAALKNLFDKITLFKRTQC